MLSGGEIAAMALIDACVRLLPGVMGKQASGPRRAFPTDYWNTRNTPARRSSRAGPIPEILISGDHAKVAAWRQAEAEAPDPGAAAGSLGGIPDRAKNAPKSTTDG